mmetsp:Transcript_21240/g.44777  ORF Transcript_21240/g.44777 Transcript_21240/m.44777 type:complete len:94 (-) Transcript_21240:144-425(-)
MTSDASGRVEQLLRASLGSASLPIASLAHSKREGRKDRHHKRWRGRHLESSHPKQEPEKLIEAEDALVRSTEAFASLGDGLETLAQQLDELRL